MSVPETCMLPIASIHTTIGGQRQKRMRNKIFKSIRSCFHQLLHFPLTAHMLLCTVPKTQVLL